MKTLTSVIFKNEKRKKISSSDGIREKIFSILSFLIVFGALAGFMVWASIYITKKLEEINQAYGFINIMLLGNFAILLLESIFQTLNNLYFSKDLKILLRMPIKSKDIIHGKLSNLIISEYQMEIIMLAIPMIVYGIMNQVNFYFYIYVTVILLVLPVIPISITATIVAIIMRFTNLIKNKSKAMYIAIILAVIVLNTVLLAFGGQISVLELFSKNITNSLRYYDTVFGIKSLALYVVESILIYLVSIMIISPIYLKGAIGTVINGNKKTKKVELKLKDFKRNSYKKAYLNKEFKIIKRTPIFLIQCIIMPLVLVGFILIISIALIMVVKNMGIDIMYQIKSLANCSWIAGGFLAILQILYMINFASIIAISKEERAAILIKCIPIKLSRQLNLKLVIGKIINLIFSIIIVSLYYVCTKNIVYSICFFIISTGLNLLSEKIKILIDLRNPKTNWDSEYAMMKQNTNVMYELFYTMIVALITIFAGLIITNINIYFGIMIVVVLVTNIALNKYIFNNDNKIFSKVIF